jgi:ribose 5-phosphate isomerase
MFGSSESGRAVGDSGNVLADLQWGRSQDVIFSESKILWVIPAILITILFLKRMK